MESLPTFLLFATMGAASTFLFFVTGKLGPFRLPASWMKHCEKCNIKWEVLYRRICPSCGSELAQVNTQRYWSQWREIRDIVAAAVQDARAGQAPEEPEKGL